MTEKDLAKLFPIFLPIAENGKFWNGKPDEFSNIGDGLNYSQEFGMTPYAKTGVYGTYNGQMRPHNGHDFAGFDSTPLVTPCKIWLSYMGYDASGYGNFVFFETESITINGETYKLEFVLGHMKEESKLTVSRWYEKGTYIGLMGSTGMSTGTHTHFGGRPWHRKTDGSWEYAFQDEFHQAARGYVDLTDYFIEKPVYNKQDLINLQKIIMSNEKKIIIEGEGAGRKGVIVNGKLQEIKEGREAAAALYVLTNNGFGQTVNTEYFNNLPKDKNF